MPANVETMMYVGEAPWHGLGTYVGDKNVDSKTAIKAAGLDWSVDKREAWFKNDEGNFVPGDGFEIVRTDKMISLGHASEQYIPLQNSEAFEFMDKIVGAGRACYHTAGSLAHGKKVWILVDMKEENEIISGDVVKNYVLLANGHTGKNALDILLTPTRVVCQNTLNIALSEKEKGCFFKFRHKGGLLDKVNSVTEAFETVSSKFKKFVEQGKILAKKQITQKQLDEFLIKLELERANERESGVSQAAIDEFKESDKYSRLVNAFETSPGNAMSGASGTLWAAVNAVTYFVDHESRTRKSDNFLSSEESRLNSAWFAGGAAKKNKAFEIALSMAN